MLRTARGARCWSRSVEPLPELWGTPTRAMSQAAGSGFHGHLKKVAGPCQYHGSISASRRASASSLMCFVMGVLPVRGTSLSDCLRRPQEGTLQMPRLDLRLDPHLLQKLLLAPVQGGGIEALDQLAEQAIPIDL